MKKESIPNNVNLKEAVNTGRILYVGQLTVSQCNEEHELIK